MSTYGFRKGRLVNLDAWSPPAGHVDKAEEGTQAARLGPIRFNRATGRFEEIALPVRPGKPRGPSSLRYAHTRSRRAVRRALKAQKRHEDRP